MIGASWAINSLETESNGAEAESLWLHRKAKHYENSPQIRKGGCVWTMFFQQWQQLIFQVGKILTRPPYFLKTIHQKPKLKRLLEESCWKETSGGNAIPISVLSSVFYNIHFSRCDTVLHQTTSQWDHSSEYGLQVTFMKDGNHYVWFYFLREYIKNISHPLVISLMLAWNPRYAQNDCCTNS